MHRGVVGAGNFIVDYVKTVDVYPAEQTLANIRSEYRGSGGAPYNVLLSLAKLGASYPLRAIGCLGGDEAGRYILDECLRSGVDASGLRIDESAPTSYTLVMVVEGTGRRTFFHQRGANALLGPDDFDFTLLRGCHLHYGYLLLLDTMDQPDAEFGTVAARVLAQSKASGLTTSVDVVSEDSGRFPTIVPAALEYADIAFMNEFESSRLTGIDLMEGGSFRRDRVCEAHRSMGYSGILVLHWTDGAAACSADGSVVWQGRVDVPAERVVSATGSGDAFAAGFLHSYLQGGTLEEGLQLGVCCAASCVLGYTCTDSVLSASECLKLGRQWGFFEWE